MGRIKTTPAFVNNQDVRLERPLSRRQRVAWDLNHRDESVQAAQCTAESTVSVRALVVSGRTNIFSTRAPEAAGWIFTGADTVAVGPGSCIPGVGYVPFRRGPDGRDQYVDFVLHHSSLPEYPVLTPYKPISYPAHKLRTKYSFLVDSAAQINLVTDANRHLLSGVTGSTGGVLGVGGGRLAAVAQGTLTITVEHQAGYPDSDHFAKFYGSVCIGDSEEQVAAGPAYAGTTDPAREGDVHVYAFELEPDEPRRVTFVDPAPEDLGHHDDTSGSAPGEPSASPADTVPSARTGAGRPRQPHGRQSAYPMLSDARTIGDRLNISNPLTIKSYADMAHGVRCLASTQVDETKDHAYYKSSSR